MDKTETAFMANYIERQQLITNLREKLRENELFKELERLELEDIQDRIFLYKDFTNWT